MVPKVLRPEARYVNLIVKVTRRCNLHCEYCGERRESGIDMPFPVVAHLTAKALGDEQLKSINFIWHGGEPLLRGRQFYEKALHIQQLGRRAGQEISNSIQTNGVLLDSSWAAFFKEKRFEVGVSLDGPEFIHDAQRPMVGGGRSYEGGMQALALLAEYGVPHGILLVMTDRTLSHGPEKMFEFLIENNIRSVGFQQLRKTSQCHSNSITQSDGRYAVFMKGIFDLWFQHDDPLLHIREFDGIINTLAGVRSSQCTLGGTCLGGHLGIDTDGDVYHCDRYVDDSEYRLGNVLEDKFDSIFNGASLKKLKIRDKVRLITHENCEWFDECKGGCPHNDYGTELSPLCDERVCDTALLYSHINERMSAVLSSALGPTPPRLRPGT